MTKIKKITMIRTVREAHIIKDVIQGMKTKLSQVKTALVQHSRAKHIHQDQAISTISVE